MYMFYSDWTRDYTFLGERPWEDPGTEKVIGWKLRLPKYLIGMEKNSGCYATWLSDHGPLSCSHCYMLQRRHERPGVGSSTHTISDLWIPRVVRVPLVLTLVWQCSFLALQRGQPPMSCMRLTSKQDWTVAETSDPQNNKRWEWNGGYLTLTVVQ